VVHEPGARIACARRGIIRSCGSTTPRPVRVRENRGEGDGAALRLRHHALRRHPSGARRHLPRVRPAQRLLARLPATTCTTCRNVTDVDDPLLERAAHTGENLDAPRRGARSRFVSRGHDRVAGCCRRTSSYGCRRIGHRDHEGHRRACSRRVPRTTSVEDIYFPIEASGHFGYESGYDDADHAQPVRRARWRSRARGQAQPARFVCCGGGTATASRIGTPTWAAAGPDGTSSAR